jgi:ArsR family transcriptional regulator, arsenate/arsenite/antimonite-responsive transcriptional repressor
MTIDMVEDESMTVNVSDERHQPAAAICCAPVTTTVLEEAEADELAEVMKALADPVRLRLVSIVAAAPTGEVCACDLPAQVGRSQPTVSHHLSLLVRAGILEREQRGKWAWFRLQRGQLDAIARLFMDA